MDQRANMLAADPLIRHSCQRYPGGCCRTAPCHVIVSCILPHSVTMPIFHRQEYMMHPVHLAAPFLRVFRKPFTGGVLLFSFPLKMSTRKWHLSPMQPANRNDGNKTRCKQLCMMVSTQNYVSSCPFQLETELSSGIDRSV